MGVTRIKTIGGATAPTQEQSSTAISVPKILPEHVEDPHILARKLNDALNAQNAKLVEAFTSPTLGGNILHGVALSAGTTTPIKHKLGRAWASYICVRAQTAAFSAYDVTNAAGLPNSDVLSLHSNNTGTYDIWVF